MCNLFRACLYFEEDILTKIIKEAGFFFYVWSDRYSFINWKILYN